MDAWKYEIYFQVLTKVSYECSKARNEFHISKNSVYYTV